MMKDCNAVGLIVAAFIVGGTLGSIIDAPPSCDIDISSYKSEGFADGAYVMMDMMRLYLQQNPEDAIWVYNHNAHVLNAYLEDVGDDRRLPDIETESLYTAVYINETMVAVV